MLILVPFLKIQKQTKIRLHNIIKLIRILTTPTTIKRVLFLLLENRIKTTNTVYISQINKTYIQINQKKLECEYYSETSPYCNDHFS